MSEAEVMKRIYAGDRLGKLEIAKAALMKRRLEQTATLIGQAIADSAGGRR